MHVKLPHQPKYTATVMLSIIWEFFEAAFAMFIKDQQLRLNRAIYHVQIHDDSTRFMSHKLTIGSLVRHELKY